MAFVHHLDEGIPKEISFGGVEERPPSPVPLPELPEIAEDADASIFSLGGLESVGSSVFKSVFSCFSGGKLHEDARKATSSSILSHEKPMSRGGGGFEDPQLLQTTTCPLTRQKRFGGLDELRWFHCDPPTQLPLDPSTEEEELSFAPTQDMVGPLFSPAAEDDEDPIMRDRWENPNVPTKDDDPMVMDQEDPIPAPSIRSIPSLLTLHEGSMDEMDGDKHHPSEPISVDAFMELKKALKEADEAYERRSQVTRETSMSNPLIPKPRPRLWPKAFGRFKHSKSRPSNLKLAPELKSKRLTGWHRVKKKLLLFGGRSCKKAGDTTALLSSSSCSSLHTDGSSTQRFPDTPVRKIVKPTRWGTQESVEGEDDESKTSKTEGTMASFLDLIRENGEMQNMDTKDHSFRKMLLESVLRSGSQESDASPMRRGPNSYEGFVLEELSVDDDDYEYLAFVSEVHHTSSFGSIPVDAGKNDKDDGRAMAEGASLISGGSNQHDSASGGSEVDPFPRFSSFEELMKWIKVNDDNTSYDADEAYQFEKELEKLSTEELAGLLDDELEKMLHGLQ